MSGPAYFLYHSIGLYPGKADDMAVALAQFSQDWGAMDAGQWPSALAARDAYLARWRAVVGAPEGSVAAAENVTAALFSVLGALPRARLAGRRVLVAADCFPSLHFLLQAAADRLDFTLETVPLREGETWVRDEDMLAAWGGDVGLALLTFVTSTASHRPDLEVLISHGRAMGSLVAVDLTQGVGILPFALDGMPADILVSTALKWLCGPPGAGMLHVRPDLIPQMQPDLRGWFSQENPFSWDLDGFRFAGDARRFDHGTPSVLAAVAAIPALDRFLAQNGPARQAHNLALSDRIIDAADARGLPLASPRDAERRGGSVMLHLPQAADPPAVVAGLAARQIHADCRGRILRLSPGEVTRGHHVDALFAALDELLRAC